MAKVMKKAQTGKNVPKGMVESEMFPGKMILKSKSNYENGEYAKMLQAGKPKPKVVPKKAQEPMKKGGKMTKAKDGNWIQKAIKKPGALRSQLGAKKGKPIPAAKLAKAAKSKGKLGQRALLAMTLKKMKK